ncbi:hypothetical protein JXA34_02015 [Patescibacteria group bacterium]|nr:hypothetical protein [Patescibacteria group bacterium]
MNKTIQKRQQKEREILLEHLRRTPIIQLACEKAGISRATYYRWKSNDKEFEKQANEAIDEGVSLMNDFAESQLISSIRDKNMTAIIYWLKHRHKAYSTRVEISGNISTIREELTEQETQMIKEAINLFKDDYGNK